MLYPLLLTFLLSVWGEYRAFELVITDEATGAEQTVLSIFDHIQYPGYYPLKGTETVSYQDSWMCWGNTNGFRAICPKPERGPAAEALPTGPDTSKDQE